MRRLDEDFQRAETLSLPITLLILVVAFGALVAAGVPLLLGLTAVMATLGLLGPVSQLFPVDDRSVSSVVLLIGLAVGVDYSLFYLRREREERRGGPFERAPRWRSPPRPPAARCSSPGITVMIAMAGMFLTGNATFMSFAVGTIIVVAVAVLGSLTVLPAVLSKLGDRVEKGRMPFICARCAGADGESRVWDAILDRVLRRPLVSAVARRRPCWSRSRSRRCGMNTGDTGRRRAAPGPADHADLRADPGRVPRRTVPAVVVVEADDVDRPAGRRRDRASCARRRSTPA